MTSVLKYAAIATLFFGLGAAPAMAADAGESHGSNYGGTDGHAYNGNENRSDGVATGKRLKGSGKTARQENANTRNSMPGGNGVSNSRNCSYC